jgi:hypothetical protein
MLIHRQRTLAKLLLLVFIALLVAVEPILFDLNSAAWGRSIEEVKTELDQTHKKYIDSVKSGTETSSVYSLYEGLLQEYNKLKTAEEAKKPADVETPTDDSNSISKLFKKFKEVFKPPWKEGKKEMSLFVKIAWGIGKALVPTLAVIGFAAFVTLPFVRRRPSTQIRSYR